MKMIDNEKQSNDTSEFDYLEKLFKQKENLEEQNITIGLSMIKQYSLDSSQQYQYVDFYDVDQEYIIICNVVHLNSSEDIQLQSILIIDIELEMNINISFQINQMIVNFSYIQLVKIYQIKFNQLNLIVLFNLIL